MIESASRELAGLIAQGAKVDGLRLLQAVVHSRAGGTVALYLSGDQAYAIGGIRFLDTYQPNNNDVVWCLKNGPDILVLGKLRPSGQELLRIVAENVTVTGELSISSYPSGGAARYSGGRVARYSRPTQYTSGNGGLLGNTNIFIYRPGRQYVAKLNLPQIFGTAGDLWQFTLEDAQTSTARGLFRRRIVSNDGGSYNEFPLAVSSDQAWSMRIRFDRIIGSGNLIIDPLPPATNAMDLIVCDEGTA